MRHNSSKKPSVITKKLLFASDKDLLDFYNEKDKIAIKTCFSSWEEQLKEERKKYVPKRDENEMTNKGLSSKIMSSPKKQIVKCIEFNAWKQQKDFEFIEKIKMQEKLQKHINSKSDNEQKKLIERHEKAKLAWKKWRDEKQRQLLLDLTKKSFLEMQMEIAYLCLKEKSEKAYQDWLLRCQNAPFKFTRVRHKEPWKTQELTLEK